MCYRGRLVSMASMQRSITSMLFATPMYLCMLFKCGGGLGKRSNITTYIQTWRKSASVAV